MWYRIGPATLALLPMVPLSRPRTVFGVLIQATVTRIVRMPESAMSKLLSTGARLNAVRVVVILIMGAGVAWVGRIYFMTDGTKPAASQSAPAPSQGGSSPTTSPGKLVANVRELPSLPVSSSAPSDWDLIDGLSAEAVEGSAVVSSQRILRLVAAGADGRHALGARFGGLAPGGVYRATAWVKAQPGVRVMIEARDAVDPLTDKPSNYGVAQFDLATRSVVNSTGDIIASGVEAAADDWVKVWVDLRSRDGQIFALIGLLEGRNNRHVFTAADQSVAFGGFEIFPPRVMNSLSQVGSPPPRTDIVTKVTNISELPPLPELPSAPDRWDLIEGLNAEAVERPVVVPGQRVLQLVAVGADGRHALGARFGGLASDRVYRATAWVKAEPGVRVMIEARDAVDPLTGKPSNYGVARADLAARSIVDSTGDIIASGVEAAGDGWEKVWVDLRSRDGQLFVTIGLLEGPSNLHVFNAAGQEVTFGGFEISPARPVQTSSQAGLPTRATNVGELPPLSESPFGPDKWDLVEGLNAEAVERPVVVAGQRILRLVAVV
jgi:hypothetical protein